MFFESFLLNLFILLALIFALIFDYVTKFFSYWYVRHVPYKMSLPFFGSDYHRVLGMRSTTTEVDRLYNQYPKDKFVGCIKSRIPDLIVKDPDAVRKILSTDFSNFHCRGLGLDKSRDVCLRNNLFYSEGAKWSLLRSTLESILNNTNVEIQDGLHDCLSGINGDTNVQQLLSELLDIVFKDLLIGNNVERSIITCLRKEFEQRTFIDTMKSYLKDIFPSVYVLFNLKTPFAKLHGEYRDVLRDTKLHNAIRKAEMLSQTESKAPKCKLNKETEEDFDYSILSLFISEGYAPCHKVLTSLLYELAKNQNVQQRAREDTAELDLSIKETLRLHPPYSIINRKCTKMYTFTKHEFLVDRGLTLSIPVEAIQRDEHNFNEAHCFKPARFQNIEDPIAYLPFGTGPRKCIGEQLALDVIQKVASIILKKFNIETCESTPQNIHAADFNFQRVIESDIWLRFKRII